MRTGSSSWRWQLSRAMRLALRWFRWCRLQRGGGGGGATERRGAAGRLLELWRYGRLLLTSLHFNSLTDSDTLLDCAFEPVYWIVDNVTRWFGVVFVCLVVLLTTSVVVIIYLFVLPTILSTYPSYWIAWHLSCGHWLLAMVVFHYYKATTTPPGHPPKEKMNIPSVSICKKCITPKPPRTHHCSICNTCVLKMDHHCRILPSSNIKQILVEQLRRPLQPALLLLLLPLHDARLLLLQREQQGPVPGGLRRHREILSDSASNRRRHRDHGSEVYHLPLGVDQHGDGRSRRTDHLAQHPHQQSRDQRGAPHQPQRDQKAPGEGQALQEPLPPRHHEQLEAAAGCGGKETLGHAGPLALQPPAQRGRHHVGLQLRQNRPHGHLTPPLKTTTTTTYRHRESQLGDSERKLLQCDERKKRCSSTIRHTGVFCTVWGTAWSKAL
ncbi:palmitoyltransferase ZDHHC16B isoform X2 [Pseudoliparis swirei]|nr:palmitoyltransferase ZDHHC16B isoform X2 [Pseudoliparis swirei]XP_056285441.1 palmitoyltransferase ZDHHC16B isoform X2 [Pseudoliparis swirei]